jgi:hypothetical protein
MGNKLAEQVANDAVIQPKTPAPAVGKKLSTGADSLKKAKEKAKAKKTIGKK